MTNSIFCNSYGNEFTLKQGKKALTLQEAIPFFANAAKKLGLLGLVGVAFDGKTRLIPSSNFISKTELQSEFTAIVEGQGVILKRIPKTKKKAAKETAPKLDLDQQASADIINEFGKVKVEGKGARKTNWANGYTVSVNCGDAELASEALQSIAPNANIEIDGNIAKVTTYDDVAEIMGAIGKGELFNRNASAIGQGEIWEVSLDKI